MFSDGREIPRRHAGYSRRRSGPGVSASRKRNRAKRGCYGTSFLKDLATRRASARRRPKDVEVARQLLYPARPLRKGREPVDLAISAPFGSLPAAIEFHGRGAAAGGELGGAIANIP